MGNWAATMIGVILGIPIALEISRRQQAAESKQRETKILILLHNELQHNFLLFKKWVKLLEQDLAIKLATTGTFQAELAGEKPIASQLIRVAQNTPMKTELWKTFTEGGEIQWIKDLDILDKLSDAYYHIRELEELRENLLNVATVNGVDLSDARTYPMMMLAVVIQIQDVFPEIAQSVLDTTSAIRKKLDIPEEENSFSQEQGS
jgi:hypothetical protein